MGDKKTETEPFSQAVKKAQEDFAPGNTPPADGNKPPADGNPPPADGNKPPADGNPPPADGNKPPVEDTPPDGLSESAKENWKKTRDEIKAAKERAVTLEASLADTQAKFSMTQSEFEQYKEKYKPDIIENLQKSQEELEYQLAMADLSASPKVKAEAEAFRKLRSNALKSVSGVLEGMPDLEDVLAMDPKTRDRKILAYAKEKDIDGRQLSRVWTSTDRLDEARTNLDKTKKEVQTDVQTWKQQKEADAEKQQRDAQVQSHQLYQQALSAAMGEKGLPQFFKKAEGEGTEIHNKLVDETINYTRKVATEPLNQQELTEVAFFAGVGRTAIAREEVMTQSLAALKSERDTLKARVTALERGTPGFDGGGGGSGEGGGGGDGKSTTPFMDRVKGEMAEASP